jgi:hypothetical protein
MDEEFMKELVARCRGLAEKVDGFTKIRRLSLAAMYETFLQNRRARPLPRVFRMLQPGAFETVFRRFIAGFAQANKLKTTGVVAIDGTAHGQCLGGGGADVSGAAQGSRPQ